MPEFTVANFKELLDTLPEHYLVHFERDDGEVFQLVETEEDSLYMIADFIFKKVESNGTTEAQASPQGRYWSWGLPEEKEGEGKNSGS